MRTHEQIMEALAALPGEYHEAKMALRGQFGAQELRLQAECGEIGHINKPRQGRMRYCAICGQGEYIPPPATPEPATEAAGQGA